MNSAIQKIEGGRASFAYQEVKDAIQKLQKLDDVKLYTSYIKRLPSMIHVNGLGQALAFYYTKSKDNSPYKPIINAIEKWLQHAISDLKFDSSKTHLLEFVVNLNSSEYRRVTSEILALLNWMQKFADGMKVQKEAENNNNNKKEEGSGS